MRNLDMQDAGFGVGSQAELSSMLPEEIERMRAKQAAQPTGRVALSKEYDFIGVESTGESTKEDRKKLAEQGISSRPIGWASHSTGAKSEVFRI